MSSPKLIVVIGATGNQGGSVVNTLLGDSTWRIRGVTRNPSSPRAAALKSRGVEIVQADMDDPASLTAAFEGANAIFAVSDFWTIYGNPGAFRDDLKPKPGQQPNEWAKERETGQLKNVIDAASRVSTLEHFIISTITNISKVSGGKYTHVCHFDSKADAAEYGKTTYPELWAKTSEIKLGFFLSNFVGDPAGMPTKKEDGTFQFAIWVSLDIKLPWIAQDEDTGPFVKSLLAEGPGKNLIAYREWLTVPEIAAAFTEATGKKAEAVQLTPGDFRFPCPEDLKLEFQENFAFIEEYGYEGRNDATLIHPKDLKSPPNLETVVDSFKKLDWTRVFQGQ